MQPIAIFELYKLPILTPYVYLVGVIRACKYEFWSPVISADNVRCIETFFIEDLGTPEITDLDDAIIC
jgi:hypothetical protein